MEKLVKVSMMYSVPERLSQVFIEKTAAVVVDGLVHPLIVK